MGEGRTPRAALHPLQGGVLELREQAGMAELADAADSKSAGT